MAPKLEPPRPVRAATAGFWGTLSFIRRKRVLHPNGVGFEASLMPQAELPAEIFRGRSRAALVRLSRAVGLPESMPDPLGLAIRVPDAYGPGRHQDLLLVSSGSRPVFRHLLFPVKGFLARPYSTLLPYRLGGEHVVIGALPAENGGAGPTLSDLRARDQADLSFDLAIATASGPWRRVARIELGKRLDDAATEALEFNPGNCGGGLELAGPLNRLRLPAYGGSQAGREQA
jgi:hypothetical protein